MAEMETEDDKVVQPQDAMETGMEGIVVESHAMAMDPEVWPENVGGVPEAMEMEMDMEKANVTAAGVGVDNREQLAPPAG